MCIRDRPNIFSSLFNINGGNKVMAKRKRRIKDVHYIERAIKSAQNECPDGCALMLFVTDGNCLRYAGARVDREDAIKSMKAWLFNQGEKENWMNHIE